jgi:hypothetical protein
VKLYWVALTCASVVVFGCNKTAGTAEGKAEDGHKHVSAIPVETSVAKAKELGIPTTIEELQASRPAAVDLAGPIYLELVSLSESADAALLERYIQGQATDAEADKAIASLKEFALIERAAAAGSFAPKRDFSMGVQSEFKEYDPMQRSVSALAARALRNARKGNTVAASADFGRALVITQHAASDDLALGEYLATVCIDHWSRAATLAAKEVPSMRAGIAKLAAQMPAVAAKEGIGTDFALIRTTVDRIRKGETTYSKAAGYETPAMVNGKSMDDLLMKNLDDAEAYALAYVVSAYENWENRGKVLSLLHESQHAAQQESPETVALHAFEALAMTLTMPLKNGEALSQAQLDCLQIAIAASDLKRKNGKAPTLSEAAADAGVGDVDPFNGKKYGFKDSTAGITVYSVGLDGEDNGGKPYVQGETKGTDVSVTL